MYRTTLFALLSLAAVLVEAAHDAHGLHRRGSPRNGIANRAKTPNPAKRCKPKTPKGGNLNEHHHTNATHTSHSTAHPTPSHKNGGGGGGKPNPGGNGLMKVTSPKCGQSGATHEITATGGPNGDEDWFNCGVDQGGWEPPMVKISDVHVVSLEQALDMPNSAFKACKQYVSIFNDAARENGLPPILVASIAMQESSCNKDTVGGAGEQGLMQLTRDKCRGDCKDPHFNIHTGASYIRKVLDDCDGNVLCAMGYYNGWFKGLTIAKATAAKHHGCCPCQNNLDYLQQVMNGWFQGIDPYQRKLGHYFNLRECGGN